MRGGHRDPPHDERPLRADEPVIIDLFPVEEENGYYSDMTRTVVKGDPSPEIREMYDALREAKQLAVSTIKPGVRVQRCTRPWLTFSASGDMRATPAVLSTISGTV